MASGSKNDIFGIDDAGEFKRPAGTLANCTCNPAIYRRATLTCPSGTNRNYSDNFKMSKLRRAASQAAPEPGNLTSRGAREFSRLG
jgi:hypothetical protein